VDREERSPGQSGGAEAPESDPDGDCVARVLGGDRDAFREIVERYQGRVFRLAMTLLKNREDATDIAQEALVRAYTHLQSFKGDSRFATWLYKIVNNLCVDLLRRRRTAPQEEFDEEQRSPDDNIAPGLISGHLQGNPQGQLLRQELGKRLQAALETLPGKHREILWLREVDGLTYEELSEVLEIPKGTVMSRLFHARVKMQKVLAEYVDAQAEPPEEGQALRKPGVR
jgi:RNA polymerase sigma-70 factor (ECF subfamily)